MVKLQFCVWQGIMQKFAGEGFVCVCVCVCVCLFVFVFVNVNGSTLRSCGVDVS
jgi:hypothetical protein